MPRLGARILPRSTMVIYSGESTVISKFSKLIDHRYRPSPGRRGLTATQRCACVAAASSVPPHELTATEIIQSIKLNKIRAVDVSKHYLERIERYDSELSCYLTVNASEVLHQAKLIDERVAKGDPVGPLAGLPVAVKDNLCTRGSPTTAGSKSLQGYIPSYDATAVAKLKRAGAIVLGKTNMDEFGMGSSTENSGIRATANPWALDRVPGGSSGGSAAAVASGLAPVALGSDTGGSIRQPAHFCGIVGLKPTYGTISRSGLLAYGSSLDTVGPMASTVRDAALLLQATSGYDNADATSFRSELGSIEYDLGSIEELTTRPMKGIKVGVIEETLGEGVDTEVERVLGEVARHLESLGALVEQVSIPSFAYGLPAYYVLALSEASSNLSRYDGIRYGVRAGDASNLKELYKKSRENLGVEVKRRILMGTYALSAGYYDAYYKRAQQVRTLVSSEMDKALQTYDILLSPVSPNSAFKIGEKSTDPLEMYKGDLMTVNINLAGVPALSIPAGTSDNGLPIGVQFIGGAHQEQKILKLGHIYEITSRDGPFRPALYF